MYLSRLRINWRHRLAWRDLRDRYELHRTVFSGFPQQMPPGERILYRMEGEPQQPYMTIFVQSQARPNWDQSERLSKPGYLYESPGIRRVQPQFQEGVCLPFRLRANPTVKRYGKRHPIYDDDALIRWLQRKGEQHGFSIDPLHVRIVKLGNLYSRHRQQTWHVVQFDGLLAVVDAEAFASALRGGVGSAKAFGCGLLSVPYPAAITVAEAYSPHTWGCTDDWPESDIRFDVFPTDVGVYRF